MQDAKMFRRKKWKYLILDEAHMIKNWRSQRWQTLLNFNSKRRLLITGVSGPSTQPSHGIWHSF
jgi:helicase SWR1